MFSIFSYLKFAKKIGHFRRLFLGLCFAILTKQRTGCHIVNRLATREKIFPETCFSNCFPGGKAGKNMKKCFPGGKTGKHPGETLGRHVRATDVSGNMFPQSFCQAFTIPTTEQIVSSAANKRTANRD